MDPQQMLMTDLFSFPVPASVSTVVPAVAG